jgi:hypothetical protein
MTFNDYQQRCADQVLLSKAICNYEVTLELDFILAENVQKNAWG